MNFSKRKVEFERKTTTEILYIKNENFSEPSSTVVDIIIAFYQQLSFLIQFLARIISLFIDILLLLRIKCLLIELHVVENYT